MGEFFQKISDFFGLIGGFFTGIFQWFDSITTTFGSWWGLATDLLEGAPPLVTAITTGALGLMVFGILWAILRGQ